MRGQKLHEEAVQPGRSSSRNKAPVAEAIRLVYGKLLKAFGPQGWWPVSRRRGGLPAYRPGSYGPLTDKQMFEVCAGAILTQNTAWNNALTALIRLEEAGALSPGAIRGMDLRALRRLIRSSGFYRQKASRLKIFSGHILARHPEGLKKWFAASSGPALRTELLTLNGIGPETADSMALYAGRKPKFVVDAYTRRIFGRLGLVEGTYDKLQSSFEKALRRDHRVYNEYHALIVALGKNYCRKSLPVCGKCPLKKLCVWRSNTFLFKKYPLREVQRSAGSKRR